MNSIATHRWQPVQALAGAFVLLALLLGLNFSSLQSMWQTWGNSNTYTHGYLVFPMVAYLIYTKWQGFADAAHEPRLMGALALIACGLMWVIAQLLNVHVVGQLMFVTMIVVLCWSYFGSKKTAVIMFPLAYLFFAVPMGEGLVPGLMSFTADFTVWALRVTGLPVFRDGMFFSIPAGDFEVAKACSGIRYLMASFALGTLYAFLSFRSIKKQFLFSLLSLIVPIIANGIRAYGIVMIAHFSNMKYAVGVDHLVYGWLFFGLVMFLLFYVGGKWRSAEDMEIEVDDSGPAASPLPGAKIVTAVVVLSMALVIPHLLNSYTRKINSSAGLVAYVPASAPGWQGPGNQAIPFEPNFSGAVAAAKGHYRQNNTDIYVWILRYPAFDPEHEMITATNTVADLDLWSVYEQVPRNVSDGGIKVIETGLGNRISNYTVWHWYQLNDVAANSLFKAKLAEAWAILSGSLNIEEALVVLATPERTEESSLALEKFVEAHKNLLRDCIIRPAADCLGSAIDE